MSNDYGLARAQMQYDAQTPPEGERICECGDDCDEHTEIYPQDDPQELLNALREIDALRLGEKPDYVMRVKKVLDTALTVCQAKNCTCRKFVARSEDDGPEE